MSDFEIERKAKIEVVGTQYEDRPANHTNLKLHQKLKLEHQKNNDFDSNAVRVLTEDNKELGFIPRGHASIYAPAIDSGKYNFSVEVVTTDISQQRPILIVDITADYKEINETAISEKIISIVQNAVNAFEMFHLEYIGFVDNDEAEADKVLDCLNNVRLYKKIISLSDEIVKKNNIQPDGHKIADFSKNDLIKELKDVQSSINVIQKKYREIFNASVDIEDEDEYQRVQKEVRQKRKAYKELNEFCIGLCEIIENYTPINFIATAVIDKQSDERKEEILDSVSNLELSTEPIATDNNIEALDFNNPDAYTGFKPMFFIYDNKRYNVNSWKQLYIRFVSILYNNSTFAQILRKYIGVSFSNRTSNHPDFADRKLSEIMRTPSKIGNNFFMETNLSTRDIIKKIKSVMLICNISTDSIMIEYDVPKKYKTIEEKKTVDESSVSINEKSEILDIEQCIVDILKNNQNNIYYQDGFNSYMIKRLLPPEYADTVTIDEIEYILSINKYIKEIESNYYVYNKNIKESLSEIPTNTESVPNQDNITETVANLSTSKTIHKSASNQNITLVINNRNYMVYDCSDALIKICEFLIRAKPFKMAYIEEFNIKHNNTPVFYRHFVPVPDYKKLSNNLQLMTVKRFSDVDEITEKLIDYCNIDRNMIILKNE